MSIQFSNLDELMGDDDDNDDVVVDDDDDNTDDFDNPWLEETNGNFEM